MTYNLAYQGMSMEQYLEYAGTTMDVLKKSVKRGRRPSRKKRSLCSKRLRQKKTYSLRREKSIKLSQNLPK